MRSGKNCLTWLLNTIVNALMGFSLVANTAGAQGGKPIGPTPKREPAAKMPANLGLSFEPNVGQADAAARFLSRGRGYLLYLSPDEAVLVLHEKRDAADAKVARQGRAPLRMWLTGADRRAAMTGSDELPGKSNYFVGNDPKGWRTNVPSFGKVKVQQVYPGIDLAYYGHEGLLEYDFLLAAGADPGLIHLRFAGAESLKINSGGDLVMTVGGAELRFPKPTVYQPSDDTATSGAKGARRVDGAYVLEG